MGHFCFYHVIVTLLKIGISLAICYFVVIFLRRELRKKKQLDQNSVIVISGGSRAIGSELAQRFARLHQCKIVLIDTEDRERINDLGKLI
jgi:FlaA1/EpsC-like NDP-sugar epimerase